MDVLGSLLLLLGVAILARWFYQRAPEQRDRQQIRKLLAACNGDQDLVERLIFAEMQRNSDLGYGEAARRALARIVRDRR